MKRKGILISIVVAAVVGGVGFGAYWWGINRGMEMSAGTGTGTGGAAVSAAGEQKAADGTATGGGRCCIGTTRWCRSRNSISLASRRS